MVMSVFQVIYVTHRRLGHYKNNRLAYWEIPSQTIESLFEYRMINFYAPNITSARLLRFTFIIFGTFFVWAYNCNLRASLMAKEMDKPPKTLADIIENNVEFLIPKGSSADTFFEAGKMNTHSVKFTSNLSDSVSLELVFQGMFNTN